MVGDNIWISPLAAPIYWGGRESYAGQANTNNVTQPPPQNPPQQPTGAPPASPAPQPPAAPAFNPADPNTWTPEQLRAHAAGPAPQPPAVPPQPPVGDPYAPQLQNDGSFQIRLATGQVYKGATAAEAYRALAMGQEEASRTITQQRQEAERLRAGISAVTGGQPAPGTPQPFDRAIYMELQNIDPIQAANYLDMHRFGFASVDAVVPTLTQTVQRGNEFQVLKTVNEFRAIAPDFPGSQQSVDAVMGYMKTNNIPFNSQNLKLVHDGMVRAGVYQAAPVLNPQFPQPGIPPNPQAPQPPQPAIDFRLLDPNPQGNYAFGPSGFGTLSAPTYSAPALPTPPPAQPQPAPVAYQQAAPAPNAYPGIPQPAAYTGPLPMPPAGGPVTGQPSVINESTINDMNPLQIKDALERGLIR